LVVEYRVDEYDGFGELDERGEAEARGRYGNDAGAIVPRKRVAVGPERPVARLEGDGDDERVAVGRAGLADLDLVDSKRYWDGSRKDGHPLGPLTSVQAPAGKLTVGPNHQWWIVPSTVT